MNIRTPIFLALAAVALLASGCTRSQDTPVLPTPVAPAVHWVTTPTPPADPIAEPEDQSTPFKSEGAAGQSQQAPLQATAPTADAPATTPLATATRSRLPGPVSDLLYLSQGHLMRWDPLTRHAISLAQNLTAFAASADGQVLVLLRPQKVTANGIKRYNLDALNLQNQQTFLLTVLASLPEEILVSPDGSQVAFTQRQAAGKSIILLPIEPDGQPQKLGDCQGQPTADCASLAWSPSGRELLWSDGLGLWQATTQPGAATLTATLVHPAKVQLKDPGGNPLEIEARFTDLQFAPTERFVLMTVTPVDSQVGWQAVFDRRSGQLAQAPDTFTARQAQAGAIWQSNGNLLVVHASEPGQQMPPFIHSWYVMPTNAELLVSGPQHNLYSDEFPFSASQSKSIPAHCLQWPKETQPNHLAFAVHLDQSDRSPVLFDLNLLNGTLTKLLELPANTAQILWAQDGVNALILGGRNQISWLSLKSGELIEVQSIFGPDTGQFVWLSPVMRR